MKDWSLNNFQVLLIFTRGSVLIAEEMIKNSAIFCFWHNLSLILHLTKTP